MAAYVGSWQRLVRPPWRSRAIEAVLALLILASPIALVPAALHEEQTGLWLQAGLSRHVVKEVFLSGGTRSFCYALAAGQGVFRAPEGRATALEPQAQFGEMAWQSVDSDLPSKRWTSMEVQALAADPSNPSVLYAGMGGRGSRDPAQSAGLYVTNDGGQTWQTPAESTAGQAVQAIAVMSHRQGYVGAVETAAGGTSSVPAASGATSLPDRVACAATTGGIYCSKGEGRLWVRLDWRSAETRVLSLAIRPDDASLIYVGTDGFGLQATADGGATWQSSAELRERHIYDIAISVFRPDVMYVATDVGVFESTDAGSTWMLLDGPAKGRRVNAIALYAGTIAASGTDAASPHSEGDENVLYAGLQHGAAYRYSIASDDGSMDGGRNWVALNKGLGSLTVLSLAVDPQNPLVLWAGTTDGVWRYALPSVSPQATVIVPIKTAESSPVSPTVLPTMTPAPEPTPTSTWTALPSATPTSSMATETPTPTATFTLRPTATRTVLASPTRTQAPSPTPTRTTAPPPPPGPPAPTETPVVIR